MSNTTEVLNNQHIVDYYDHCQVDYSIVWHFKNSFIPALRILG